MYKSKQEINQRAEETGWVPVGVARHGKLLGFTLISSSLNAIPEKGEEFWFLGECPEEVEE